MMGTWLERWLTRIIKLAGSLLRLGIRRFTPQLIEVIGWIRASLIALGWMIFESSPILSQLAGKGVAPALTQRRRARMRFALLRRRRAAAARCQRELDTKQNHAGRKQRQQLDDHRRALRKRMHQQHAQRHTTADH
jgi:hypothetical protein